MIEDIKQWGPKQWAIVVVIVCILAPASVLIYLQLTDSATIPVVEEDTNPPWPDDLQIVSSFPCNEACQIKDYTCLQVKNNGTDEVRIKDLGSAQVTYDIGVPSLGMTPISNDLINAAFIGETDNGSCCRFSEMAGSGECGALKKSISPNESFIIGFFGTFKDADGRENRFTYSNATQSKLTIQIILPSGWKGIYQLK